MQAAQGSIPHPELNGDRWRVNLEEPMGDVQLKCQKAGVMYRSASSWYVACDMCLINSGPDELIKVSDSRDHFSTSFSMFIFIENLGEDGFYSLCYLLC